MFYRFLLPPSRRSRSIQPYPLPHYPLTPLQPTSQSLRPIHPAISSPLPPGRRLPPPRRRLPSPRRRLSSSPPSHLPPPSPLPPPRRRLPPPRRRLSSSPPSPLLLPAVASPPSRPSPLFLPAVAFPSSPRSPLPPPRRCLSLLPAVASPYSSPSPLLPSPPSGDRCTSASAGWYASTDCFIRHRGYQKKEMERKGERVRI
ncbi:unnamed protein product [Closterium sp. NIES-64]|nr:unnamed protein product [Closterium sp. NIES-64]